MKRLLCLLLACAALLALWLMASLTIASAGQLAAQVPQSRHLSASIS